MALPTTFDALFNRYRNRVPLNYMRALTKKESNFNPNESNDPAWGLMQVVPVVREGYNSRYGTSYTKQDLLNPDINVKIVADLLNRIVIAYGKHPDANMQENWGNPEFVKLVTAGWNSGYSEGGGVGKVATWLNAHGIRVTHDSVFQYADQAGATTHLQDAFQKPPPAISKKTWQRQVTDLYFAEGGPGIFYGVFAKLLLTIGVSYLVYRALT